MSTPMRVLFSGSRAWTDRSIVQAHIDELPEGATVVVGDCPTGVDEITRRHALDTHRDVEVHQADWKQHGKAAGPIRNQEMIDSGVDCGYFYITPQSRGTRHCLTAARRANIPAVVTQEDR